MNYVKLEEMKVGRLFYECQSGMNLEAVVVRDAEKIGEFEGRAQWAWAARNTQTGGLIEYLSTVGLGAYGPKIYDEPQYVSVRDGVIAFSLLGETFQDPARDPAALRDPAILEAWVRAQGDANPGQSLLEWSESLAKDALEPEMGI
jgi:hypothetical protein